MLLPIFFDTNSHRIMVFSYFCHMIRSKLYLLVAGMALLISFPVSGNVVDSEVEEDVKLVYLRPENNSGERQSISHDTDTIPLREFKRDIESVVFVPKGQWITGVSVSYQMSTQNKYQFLIFEDISGDTYSFKVSPMLMFAVKNDLALGGRFSYARSLTKLENANIIMDSESDYQIDHLYRLSHNYYGTVMMRNYFSIGRSTRFGFFNELQLQLGGGQSKITTGVGSTLTGTYERNFSLDVGLAPGICLFLNNYSALEVNIGVLGFSYSATKGIKDQIYVSRRNSKLANFRINLFSIQFGVSFYL